jgi:hypothetical protein
MRKLRIVQLASKEVDPVEGYKAESVDVEIEEGKKTVMLVFKSDDIDEQTLTRLKPMLREALGNTVNALAFCVGASDSLEVYEVE